MPSSYFYKNNHLDLKNSKGKQARLDHNGTDILEQDKAFQWLRNF